MQQIPTAQPRVAFVQIGSRLHYAVPLAIQRAGMLDRVYVDWYTRKGSAQELASKLVGLFKPDLGRKMMHRRCDELDDARVVGRSTLRLLMIQRLARQSLKGRWEKLLAVMAKSAELNLRNGFGEANVLMAFLRENHPSLFEGARARGLWTVGDQIIAPAAIEHEELTEQFRRWPGWQRAEWTDYLPKVAEVERRCWASLDHLTCASEYVKQGLVREGVDADKISVLPYPLDVHDYPYVERKSLRTLSDPVTVGFVGHIHLRKGVPYFCEVAKRLRGRGIRFVMVGPSYLESAVVDAHRDAVDFIGAVPRSEVPQWLGRFDVLLFPSTCEGSSGAVMEAMASGLPVVTSPNSGAVARHGTEGYVVPYDQIDAMADAVERLASDPALRHDMGHAASRRAGEFTVEWYSRELGRVLKRLVAGSRGSTAEAEAVVTAV